MDIELPTEIAIVTGAGSGIGAAIAKRLAEMWPVLVIGRRFDRLVEVADGNGTGLIPWAMDVTDRSDVDRLAEKLRTDGVKVSALVNNAGLARSGAAALPQTDLRENWDTVIATNLTGAFQLAMAVAPFLRRPGGRIVNIGSIAAYTGGRSKGSAIYAASKAGMNGLTVGLAREFSDEGITVNAVAPGLVAETEFTGGWDPERVRQMVSETPVGRAGTASEIAATVAFLCGSEAGYITGQVIHQNGGTYFAP
ncbi:SDR family NAD(P)-dependent oxidoreductase [Nisaea sediminum]|uniref:SDR family NAD(P)-dependent oxidoreductase n=1 Tax=Nisaea sediminum TaxID=2775867 RepID=UPI001867548B|nr:SDR family oxidoreductase [Nisaea sediminum]